MNEFNNCKGKGLNVEIYQRMLEIMIFSRKDLEIIYKSIKLKCLMKIDILIIKYIGRY